MTTRPIGSAPVSVTGTLTENAWNHVVISKADQDITFYLNGENKGTAQATSAGLTYFDGVNPVNLTGINASPKYNILDGYLSDAYFVDGQALDCKVFGKEFVAGWGPLDSSVVDENIKAKSSPYDTRPNMEQDWTSYLTADSGSVAQLGKGFDGDLTTNTYTVNNDGTLIWTPTTPLNGVTKFEIYRANSGNADNNARLNNQGGFIVFPQDTWTTLHDGAEITVSNLQVAGYNNNNGLLGAVRVNGVLLVDGPADNSQVWSSNGQSNISDWQNAFNGNTANSAYVGPDVSSTVTFDPPLSGEIEVFASNGSGVSQDAAGKDLITLSDGSVVDVSAVTSGNSAWFSFGTVSGITSLTISGASASQGTRLCAVRVDGIQKS